MDIVLIQSDIVLVRFFQQQKNLLGVLNLIGKVAILEEDVSVIAVVAVVVAALVVVLNDQHRRKTYPHLARHRYLLELLRCLVIKDVISVL